MSKPTEEPSPADGKKSKKRLLIIILIAVLAIGAGAGGTWYAMKMLRQLARPRQPLHLVFLQALQQRPILRAGLIDFAQPSHLGCLNLRA